MTAAGAAGVRPGRLATGTGGPGRGVTAAEVERVCAPAADIGGRVGPA